MTDAHPLASLFRPRSIAIVGASEKSAWTLVIARSLKSYGVKGPAFAVNRNGTSVLGMPGYVSCTAIPERVDAAYICVPQEAVNDAIEDVGRAGIRAAVVLTSGFGETGTEGAERERRLAETASKHGIRLLGPNCLGFANIAERAALTSILPRGPLLENGHVAFVCQSGATGAEILELTQQQGVAVNFFAATGNEAQICVADIVDYLVDDPVTRVIMVFAETIRNAPRFSAAARRALRVGKPIVVLKVGASALSASVARAHTGSLVGNDRVFSAACRQLGVIRVHSLEDLVVTASLLVQTGPLRPGGVGVASISGGACTLIGDRAESEGMPLPPFAPETVSALREVLPSYANTLNPLDITGAAVRDFSLFEKTLSIMVRDPNIAVRIGVLNLPHMEGTKAPSPEMLACVGAGLRAGDTPGLLCVQTLKPVTDVSRRIMREAGIPGVTGGLDHAVRALSRAVWWSARHRAAAAETAALSAGLPPSSSSGRISRSATHSERDVLDSGAPESAPRAPRSLGPSPLPSTPRPNLQSERDVLDYLARFGVPVIPATLAHSAQEAITAARRFGGRVALKVASPDIAHKTEAGGVKLRLEGDAAVAQAFDEINSAVRAVQPGARIDGVLVSPMRERGIELFVGTSHDPDWGTIIAVGVGGIWVEALQDTAVRVLPVTRDDIIDMLESLRAAKILRGFRGGPAADLAAVADIVVCIGNAALALGSDVASVEINPLLVDGTRVEALDGLCSAQKIDEAS